MMKKQIGVWVDAGEELYGVIVYNYPPPHASEEDSSCPK